MPITTAAIEEQEQTLASIYEFNYGVESRDAVILEMFDRLLERHASEELCEAVSDFLCLLSTEDRQNLGFWITNPSVGFWDN